MPLPLPLRTSCMCCMCMPHIMSISEGSLLDGARLATGSFHPQPFVRMQDASRVYAKLRFQQQVLPCCQVRYGGLSLSRGS